MYSMLGDRTVEVPHSRRTRIPLISPCMKDCMGTNYTSARENRPEPK
eukprot:CAMPEP_0179319568 /NCGR_PEP_ID=MMETSP0797-20121207/57552_1 /TAXON_ID=47934 /ORGANISM="Dinophysis acuminata, Strain DAEP01" /LENGTH=46 /DNA_ID= /DNA_START= /DNA_END= /DNA_ORIENTATION=